jgi:hypothetical protein
VILFQVRSAAQFSNSQVAIFAAETGLECELFRLFKDASFVCDTQTVQMSNGSTFTTSVTGTDIRSQGVFRKIVRALEASF